MLSWKEYPRENGGLAKYLQWFKDFRRPRDLIEFNTTQSEVSLFGSTYDKSGSLLKKNFEQGTLGDNYFMTVVAAIADQDDMAITNLFH